MKLVPFPRLPSAWTVWRRAKSQAPAALARGGGIHVSRPPDATRPVSNGIGSTLASSVFLSCVVSSVQCEHENCRARRAARPSTSRSNDTPEHVFGIGVNGQNVHARRSGSALIAP